MTGTRKDEVKEKIYIASDIENTRDGANLETPGAQEHEKQRLLEVIEGTPFVDPKAGLLRVPPWNVCSDCLSNTRSYTKDTTLRK